MKCVYCSYYLVLAILLVASLPARVQAFPLPHTMPLLDTVTKADLILVGRVEHFRVITPQDPRTDYGWSKDQEMAVSIRWLKYPGVYDLKVLQALKGETPPALQVILPVLSRYYYPEPKLRIEDGSAVLLLLKHNAAGHWTPVDPTVPLIPLANDESLLPPVSGKDVYNQVVSLMLASLADPILRPDNTYLLRTVRDNRVAHCLAPFLDDPNLFTQDNVASCLLTNGQASVIPHIFKLADVLLPTEIQLRSPMLLYGLKLPGAAPYLNPFLLQPNPGNRYLAMTALNGTADRSSIPYLLLALRDPSKLTVCWAQDALQRVIGSLGPDYNPDYSNPHRIAETRHIFAWWDNELSGKHSFGNGSKISSATLPSHSTIQLPAGLPTLNPLLFVPERKTREAVITTLKQKADAASIPSLILALQDPDWTVAYGAYTTLHCLLPVLGPTREQSYFKPHRLAESQPIYRWWTAELQGQHA